MAETSQLGHADGDHQLAGRSAREWAARGEALRSCISGAPGAWQTRSVAGPLSAEELHDHVRRENAATIDVYRFAGGEVIAVVPSEREGGQPGAAMRIFRRVFIATGKEAVKSAATGLIGVSIGVPVASLLNVPTDFAGAGFYAVGLSALCPELGME